MQVSSVSQNIMFNGKIRKTDNGNDYESSSTGKTVLPIIAAAGNIFDAVAETKKNGPAKGVGFWLLAIGVCYGIGALLDNGINKTRKKDADKYAQTGEISKNTNKGKKIGTEIGAGIGAAVALTCYAVIASKKQQTNKAVKLLPVLFIPLSVLPGLFYGWIYDHGVNKFRKSLLQKSHENTLKNKTPEPTNKV